MCQKCNVKIDDSVVVAISNEIVLMRSRLITFTHAGHSFSGTFTNGLDNAYTLELENKVDEVLLGELLTDRDFLQYLDHLTVEYGVREIFKTPHVFYIEESEDAATEDLSLDPPPQE
jgi:hypothetical protein